MNSKRFRIALLLAAPPSPKRQRKNPNSEEIFDIVNVLPEMFLMGDITPIPSIALAAHAWTHSDRFQLAREIQRVAASYDGVVIAHPWRLLTLTSSFVALALTGTKTPIVFMGPHPSDDEEGYVHKTPVATTLGIRAYMMNVFHVVIYGHADVMVIDGARVYQAVHVTTTTKGPTFTIEPYQAHSLGSIDVGFEMNTKEPSQASLPRIKEVPRTRVWRPVSADDVFIADPRDQAVFVDLARIGGPGAEHIKMLRALGIPIGFYGHKGNIQGMVRIPDMAPESALAKFVLSAAVTHDRQKIQERILKNWRGEML